MNKPESMLLACLLFASVVAVAHTDGDCAAFSWDVSRELTVMRSPAQSVSETDAASGNAKALHLDVHYTVHLAPQPGVKFVSAPDRAARSEAPRAAVLHFEVPTAGRYRVSISTRHWIDVIDSGRSLASAAHQGGTDCALLHKVVEFELPAGRDLALQLSGQDDAVVGLAITGPVSAPTPSTG